MCPFCNKASFYGEGLSAPCTTPKLEDHPLPAVSNCLFNIYAATLHNGGCSSICNLRTYQAMVTGPTYQSHIFISELIIRIMRQDSSVSVLAKLQTKNT